MGIMLKRLVICLFLSGWPVMSAAQTIQESIVAQLEAQGFVQVEAHRTWLGRIRLVAVSDSLWREIVFNPQSGEILRDYWHPLDDEENDNRPRVFNPSRNSDSKASSRTSGGGASRVSSDDSSDDNRESVRDDRKDEDDEDEREREDREDEDDDKEDDEPEDRDDDREDDD